MHVLFYTAAVLKAQYPNGKWWGRYDIDLYVVLYLQNVVVPVIDTLIASPDSCLVLYAFNDLLWGQRHYAHCNHESTMGAFENLMQARENEQRHEGPFDICCCWDRTTPHCVVNVLKCLFRLAVLGEGGKWRNMRTGTPLQPEKCFICSLCYEHTHTCTWHN